MLLSILFSWSIVVYCLELFEHNFFFSVKHGKSHANDTTSQTQVVLNKELRYFSALMFLFFRIFNQFS